MNIYHNIIPINKELAEKMFSSDNIEEICTAMVSSAFYQKDWRWIQDKCLTFLMNSNSDISGLAATCLGHIARIHHRLDKEKVIQLLSSRIDDIEISGRIEDALNDIEIFIK